LPTATLISIFIQARGTDTAVLPMLMQKLGLRIWATLAAATILGLGNGTAEDATTLTAAFSFDAWTDGVGPSAALFQGPDGALYSTCRGGPGYAMGTVYRFTLDGGFTNLCSFFNTNGSNPGEIVFGKDGNIYGVTDVGGPYGDSHGEGGGTIFKVAPDGQLTSLFSFAGTNGCWPQGSLAEGPDGNFYGTTVNGGIGFTSGNTGNGTVFRITPQGALTTLVFFDGTNALSPRYGLVLGRDGNFYGEIMCLQPPGPGNGAVFKMTLKGDVTYFLVSDGTNALAPYGGLTEAADGSFYGLGWSIDNADKVFRITTNGVVTIIQRFAARTQARRLTPGTDGFLYGVTYLPAPQEAFRVGPDGSYDSLGSFTGPNGRGAIEGTIMQASSGDFYGATQEGGANGFGVIYRLHVPGADSPKIQALTTTPSGLGLSWVGLPGRSYQLQWKSGFDRSDWGNVGEPVTATNKVSTVSATTSAQSQGFYRLALLP
jgi:uncharacterized repeat protein (TIGR03803 family)